MTKQALSILSLSFLLFSCTKGENAGNGTGTGSTPSGGATSSATPTPVATTEPTTPPTPTPTESAAPTPSTTTAMANAKKDAGASATASGTAATPAKAVSTRIAGNNFALDVASAGCKADADCAMTIKLATSGDWHLNKDYPYKFLASAAPNVTFLGKGEATTFGKQSGDFVADGEKAATLTVRFKPQKAGDAVVSGTYKLSVCSADQCQIEQQKVSLTIPVM